MEGYIGKSLLPLIHITDSTANGVKTNYGPPSLKLTKQKVSEKTWPDTIHLADAMRYSDFIWQMMDTSRRRT